MAHYYAKFIPSIDMGASAGPWELYMNAEVPGNQLKKRAKTQRGCPNFLTSYIKHGRSPQVNFPDADGSAAMLIWVAYEVPLDNVPPDQIWYLKPTGGLIRTPWSVIVGPDSEVGEEAAVPEPEPEIAFERDEDEVLLVTRSDIWRPPTPEEVKDRKLFLLGDRRPLLGRGRPLVASGIRRPCPECGVVPHVRTNACNC